MFLSVIVSVFSLNNYTRTFFLKLPLKDNVIKQIILLMIFEFGVTTPLAFRKLLGSPIVTMNRKKNNLKEILSEDFQLV